MKNKICFIITKSEMGGAQKWVKEQIDILRDEFDIYLVTNQKGWLTKNSFSNEILVDKGIENRFSIMYLISLYKFVKKNKINIMVASSANAGLYSRLLNFFSTTKVVYVSHGWSALYNGGKLKEIFKYIELILSRFTDAILCVSESDYKKALFEIKIEKIKLKLIKNKIKPLIKRSDKRIDNKRHKLLTVSRLKHPKKVDLLVKSVKDLKCDLYIVGDGPQRDKIKKIILENNINNVFLLGEIKDFDRFDEYDAFVLISESEGLPLSAIEAMSVGLPIILSDVGGCSELVNGNGQLVKNNIENIKKAIEKVFENKKPYGIRSKELFDKNYNLLLNKEEYIYFYKSLLK
jgi:glycosyltransferase involved in cell wall biosynthesis